MSDWNTSGPAGSAAGPPSLSDSPEASFSNEPIDPINLPNLADQTFENVHPNHLKVRWIGDFIFAAIVVLVASSILTMTDAPRWIPVAAAGVLLVLTALAALIQKFEVDKLGYLVRERDFSYRQGVIFTSVNTMPYARVQHVSIDRGPVERMFGLATLTMKSAGGDVVVGGLPPDVADRLKALVVDRSGASADNEMAFGDGSSGPADELPNAEGVGGNASWPAPLDAKPVVMPPPPARPDGT